MSTVGENIRKLRKSKGLSQTRLAEMIGETKQTVWKYESGTVTNIPLTKVEALSAALSCEPAQLLGWGKGEGSGLEAMAEEAEPYLTGREAGLLENFRLLDRENQDRLIRNAQTMLDAQDSGRGREGEQ